jgi:hypothetical protein
VLRQLLQRRRIVLQPPLDEDMALPLERGAGLFLTEPETLFGLGVGMGAFAGFDWATIIGEPIGSGATINPTAPVAGVSRVTTNSVTHTRHSLSPAESTVARCTTQSASDIGLTMVSTITRTFFFHAGPSFSAHFRATAGGFPGGGAFHSGGHR